jgi:hypothetical protein
MKIRTLIGWVVVLAFVVGGYLGGIFSLSGPGRGPGRGAGSGDGKADSAGRVRGVSQEKSVARDAAEKARVLHVTIDGRSYAIERDGALKTTPLDALIALVQHYPGDSQGIRVSVSRRPNSKTTAEIELRDALVAAGLSEGEIDWQDGPPP